MTDSIFCVNLLSSPWAHWLHLSRLSHKSIQACSINLEKTFWICSKKGTVKRRCICSMVVLAWVKHTHWHVNLKKNVKKNRFEKLFWVLWSINLPAESFLLRFYFSNILKMCISLLSMPLSWGDKFSYCVFTSYYISSGIFNFPWFQNNPWGHEPTSTCLCSTSGHLSSRVLILERRVQISHILQQN